MIKEECEEKYSEHCFCKYTGGMFDLIRSPTCCRCGHTKY